MLDNALIEQRNIPLSHQHAFIPLHAHLLHEQSHDLGTRLAAPVEPLAGYHIQEPLPAKAAGHRPWGLASYHWSHTHKAGFQAVPPRLLHLK